MNSILLLGSAIMGNIVNTVRRFSRSNADVVPFRKYSSLSNDAPSTGRLDKCTCDKDSSVTMCGPLDVRGSESSPKASLKRRAKRKITNHKASAKIIVPTEDVGTLAYPDVKYPETVRSPLTRSKAMALSVSTPEYHRLRSTGMGRLAVPPSDSGSQNIICDAEKLPMIPFVEPRSTDKVLKLTPLMIRTPLPHVRSSLTPSEAKVLSVPTLQLRSSRSGRLIVPRLDPATQSIIYNRDGSISGVTNSVLKRPQGCESERPAKRSRKSQCPTPYRGRSLQFDGNI